MILKVKIFGNGGAGLKHKKAYEALPELFSLTDSDDYDIADLCSPPWVHFDQAVGLLRLGRHVIIEKPICGSLQDCDLLADEARVADKRVVPVLQYRFAGHEPVGNQIICRWQRGKSYYDGWRGDWNQAFGGCATSHAIHAIDLMIQKHGMPLMVTAGMNTSLGVENVADIFLGEPGRMFRIATIVSPHVETGGFDFGDQHMGFVEQFRLTHKALTTGGPLPVTLAEARKTLEVLTAAYYSVYTGEPVMLPIEPDHPFFGGWSQAFAERGQRQQRMSPVSR